VTVQEMTPAEWDAAAGGGLKTKTSIIFPSDVANRNSRPISASSHASNTRSGGNLYARVTRTMTGSFFATLFRLQAL
jgi:hypothetical protein